MSTMEEIDEAVKEIDDDCNYALLHCNSVYPAPIEDLNLSCIKTLSDKYGCRVGYSGHEYGLTTTIASLCFGATIIERHITLDKSMWGTDQMSSVEPHGLIKLVRGVRELEKAIGDGNKIVTEREMIVKEKLRK